MDQVYIYIYIYSKHCHCTKFERLEKRNTELLEKIYISKTIFTKMTKIMERISFKLKLTSNVPMLGVLNLRVILTFLYCQEQRKVTKLMMIKTLLMLMQ